MPGRPPPPALRWATFALIAVLAGAAAFGVVAPAAATTAGPTDDPLNETTSTTAETTDDTTDAATTAVEDTVDETASTTDDAHATTDNATDSTTQTVNETAADATGTVNETTSTLVAEVEHTSVIGSEPVGALTATLDATVEEPADALPDAPTVTEASVLDIGEVGSTTTHQASGQTDAMADRPEPASTGVPERTLATAAPPAGGPEEPTPVPPLLTGAVAVSGLLVGAATLRSGLGLSTMRPRGKTLRWTARVTASRARARWLDWLRRLGALVGYQRYDDADPLEHETRAAVLEAIEASDAAYLAELGRETDVPLSTLRYHLRVLERESLVSSVKRRGKRCYVTVGDEPSALDAALNDDGAAAVLAALAAGGPDSVSGLAETLGRDVSTVTHHLQRLEADGLVVRERAGRAVENRLEPEVRAALAGGTDRTTAERARAAARLH